MLRTIFRTTVLKVFDFWAHFLSLFGISRKDMQNKIDITGVCFLAIFQNHNEHLNLSEKRKNALRFSHQCRAQFDLTCKIFEQNRHCQQSQVVTASVVELELSCYLKRGHCIENLLKILKFFGEICGQN